MKGAVKTRVDRQAAAKSFDASVGNRIQSRRLLKGWKQSEIAEKIGKSEAQLSRYESGMTTCEPYTLALIAKALGCKPSDLLDGIEVKR